MPYQDTGDQRKLYYQDPNPKGNPAVLLLHGLGANSDSWQLQVEDLISEGYRPLVPDLPGFGKSVYKGSAWSIQRIAREMASFVESLGISSISVVGISMGGTVALDLAILFPNAVRLLVLASTFACLRPDSLSGWGYFLRRYAVFSLRGLPEQAELVALRIFPEPGQIELRRLLVEQVTQADPKVYRQAMQALGFFDVRRRLKEIKATTLVISGGCDTTVPLKNQRELIEGIPNARQVIIAKAGHAVTIDQPVEFNAVLLEFLKNGLQD